MARQWRPSPSPDAVDAGLVDGVALVVERPGQQAGGGGLADPAHAGEHEGVGDAAGGEGVLQRPDHGLLADQVVEGPRPVLAGDDGVGGARARRRRARRAEHVGGGLVTGAASRSAAPGSRVGVEREVVVGHTLLGLEGQRWRPADDPEQTSLRLLPSGPDRVGEASAHRRSPRPISRGGAGGRKPGAALRRAVADTRQRC